MTKLPTEQVIAELQSDKSQMRRNWNTYLNFGLAQLGIRGERRRDRACIPKVIKTGPLGFARRNIEASGGESTTFQSLCRTNSV